MRVLPCGDRALLVELPDAQTRRRWQVALERAPIAGVVEVVPAAITIGVLLDGSRSLDEVANAVRGLTLDQASSHDHEVAEPVTIEVSYDGQDLAEVARLLGWSVAELITWHTGQLWTCDFTGFLPGFGYLVGSGEPVNVPRRASPRPRIAAGSVGVAGLFSGVYPQASPGGWQLIGRTTAQLWDDRRETPNLLSAGVGVRFVAVERP